MSNPLTQVLKAMAQHANQQCWNDQQSQYFKDEFLEPLRLAAEEYERELEAIRQQQANDR